MDVIFILAVTVNLLDILPIRLVELDLDAVEFPLDAQIGMSADSAMSWPNSLPTRSTNTHIQDRTSR
ncbi:hypothetical protein WL93_25840 [Burkholderia diffusa]|nr:hypothetical protein WL93_25840 [Burkholderia diffusa]